MNKHTYEMLRRLESAGLSSSEALQVRRCAMTLHRWFEEECGNSDAYKSWAIERDGDGPDSLPYRVIYPHTGERSIRYRVPDRETGARRRLAKIIARHPGLSVYIQTDPRGASVYVLRPGDIRDGADPSTCYTNGIAVFK